MAKIENISSIKLNGNIATKIAPHYNKKGLGKDKTLLTVLAGEEMMKNNKDILRKLNSSLLTDSLTCRSILNSSNEKEYRDDLYNLPIEFVDNYYFKYKSSATNRIKIDDSFCFLSSKICDSETGKVYESDHSTVYLDITCKYSPYLLFSEEFLNEFNLDILISTHSNLILILNSDYILKKDISISYSGELQYEPPIYVKIEKDYEELNLEDETINENQHYMLFLGKNFFKFENLDAQITPGKYGDWSNFKGYIIVNHYSLNTRLRDKDDILERLKEILNLPSDFENFDVI